MEITTPRGRIIQTKNFNARIVWSPGFRKAAESKLAKGGEIQKFIDATVLKGCEPYIPMRSGTAKKSGILHTNIGSGVVQWKTPYIRYIYYGKVMVGPAPKKVTDIDLVYHGGGLRGKLWCERYKRDHLKDLHNKVRSKLKGGIV